jgi:hypothetical protein
MDSRAYIILLGDACCVTLCGMINVNWLTHARACVLFSYPPQDLILGMGAIQVSSSRNGAKSRKQSRKSRSTGTRATRAPASVSAATLWAFRSVAVENDHRGVDIMPIHVFNTFDDPLVKA